MKYRPSRILYLLIFSFSLSCFAEVDLIEWQISENNRHPYFWDNIESGSSHWVSGERPDYSFFEGQHCFNLEAGEESIVRIPAFSELLLKTEEAEQEALADLDIAFSISGELWVEDPAMTAQLHGNELRISPGSEQPLFCRLRCPENEKQKAIHFAAYIKRFEHLSELVAYRDDCRIAADEVTLVDTTNSDRLDWSRLEKDKAASVSVNESNRVSRVQIRTRLKYPDSGSSRLQHYSMIVSDEKTGWEKVIDFKTTPENQRILKLEGEYPILGKERTAYVMLPADVEALEIQCNDEVLVRIQQKEKKPFLFQSWNAPEPFSDDLIELEYEKQRFIEIGASIEAPTDFQQMNPRELERHLEVLAMDNAYQESGLTALAAAGVLNRNNEYRSEWNVIRNQLYGTFSSFRNLLPEKSTGNIYQSYFYSPELKRSQDKLFYAYPEYKKNLTAFFPRALFSSLSEQLVYQIPPRPCATQLQLVVSGAAYSFTLSVPGEKDRIFSSRDDEEWLSSKMFKMTNKEAVLALSAESGFAEVRDLQPLNKARIWTLTIPAETAFVRLKPQKGSPDVALRYRSSKKFEPTESDYLHSIGVNSQQGEHSMALFKELYASDDLPDIKNSSFEAFKLIQSWSPLLDFMKSRFGIYTSRVRKMPEWFHQTTPVPGMDYDAEFQQALDWMKEEKNAAALDQLSQIARTGSGALRVQAYHHLSHVLQKMNENYLAETILRGLLLDAPYDAPADTLEQTVHLLDGFYRQEGNDEALLQLYATVCRIDGRDEYFSEFVRLLSRSGKHQFAVILGSLLPESNRPEALLDSAYIEGWNALIETSLSGMPKERRSYWKAWQSLLTGDYDTARDHFVQAGETAYLVALDEGLALRKLLEKSESNKLEKNTVERWAVWQDNIPGKKEWVNAGAHIVSSAGDGLLYVQGRDLYARGYLADRKQPLELDIYGPVRLQVSMRPLHDVLSAGALTGRLYTSMDGSEDHTLIVENKAAEGIVYVSNPEFTPGRQEVCEILVPSGRHSISLLFDASPAVFFVEQSLAQKTLPLLPILTVKNTQEILRDGRISPDAGLFESLFPSFSSQSLFLHETRPHHVDWYTIERSLYRMVNDESEGTEYSKKRFSTPIGNTSEFDIEAIEVTSDAVATLTHLTRLLDAANEAGSDTAAIEAIAQNIAADFPDHKRIQQLLSLIAARNTWTRFSRVDESAGTRIIKNTGWNPGTIKLQTRKSLFHQDAGHAFVLSDSKEQNFTVQSSGDKKMKLLFEWLRLPYIHVVDPEISMQIDDAMPVHIRFLEDASVLELEQYLEAGEHTIKLSFPARRPGQYVKIQLLELDPESEAVLHEWKQENKVAFHISTKENPLVLMVPGPAWLRVDKLSEGQITQAFQFVSDPSKRLEFSADADQEQTLYRIFRRVSKAAVQEGTAGPDIRDAKRTIQSRPWQPLNAELDSHQFSLQDQRETYRMGRQEDGSWEWNAGWRKRTHVLDDESTSGAEAFTQFRVTHRFESEVLPAHYKNDFIARVREDGGPTMAWNSAFYYNASSVPLAYHLELQNYAQNPDADQMDFSFDELELHSKIQFRVTHRRDISSKWYYIPSLSLFKRLHIMDDQFDYDPRDVDGDVYTPYKFDHQAGLSLGMSLYYAPWRDTLFYSSIRFNSNEDLNLFSPDNQSFKMGWKQKMGLLNYDLSYRHSFYNPDSDRKSLSSRKDLKLEMEFDRWFRRQDRFQLLFDLTHDLAKSDTVVGLSLSWHFSEGRALKDFRAGEVDFKNLRKIDSIQDTQNDW